MADLQVAATILSQLGGRRFIAMTGARDLVGGEDFLMFRLPRGFAKDGINKVKITLDWTDTYIVEGLKINYHHSSSEYETVKKVELVYADKLQDVFTEMTGLDTHL